MTEIKLRTNDSVDHDAARRTLPLGCGPAMSVGVLDFDLADRDGARIVFLRYSIDVSTVNSHLAMSKTLTLCISLSLLVPEVLFAGSYRTGKVYGTLITNAYDHACGDRLYDPEVFALPNGDLRLLAQGNSDSVSDYIFGFTRSAADGVWSLPTSSRPLPDPALRGTYTRCAYSSFTHPQGPIASPSVVRVDERYYMAYVGGNADGITGKVYWAVSSDGLAWNLYDWGAAGRGLTPIVDPIYHEECSGLNGDNPSGADQVSLNFEDGYFYVHIRYSHFSDAHYRRSEVVAFRFTYNANHPFGIGPTHEVWQMGRWIADSGRLVWNYDNAAPYPGDPVLTEGSCMVMNTGAGDVKFDRRLSAWVHFAQSNAGEPIDWEYSSSLASGQWTYGGIVDTTTMTGSGPYAGKTLYYPGIYNGPLCNGCAAGSYIMVPFDNFGCDFGFSGLGIVPAELIYTP